MQDGRPAETKPAHPRERKNTVTPFEVNPARDGISRNRGDGNVWRSRSQDFANFTMDFTPCRRRISAFLLDMRFPFL